MTRAWMKGERPRAACPVCRKTVKVTPRARIATHTSGGYGVCEGTGRPTDSM
jgi:hypothetical protein